MGHKKTKKRRNKMGHKNNRPNAKSWTITMEKQKFGPEEMKKIRRPKKQNAAWLEQQDLQKNIPFPRTQRRSTSRALLSRRQKTGSAVQMKEKDGDEADRSGEGPNQQNQLMQFPAELRISSSQSNYQYEVSRLSVESWKIWKRNK